MSVLFGITFIGAILLSTWPICADSCCLACCKRDIEVHELILEAGEDIVSKTMKEEQQSKLSANVKKYIDQGKWVNCLDVVEEFIDTIGRDEVSQTVSLLFYRMTCEVKSEYLFCTLPQFSRGGSKMFGLCRDPEVTVNIVCLNFNVWS